MKLRNKKTRESGYYLHTHRDHKTGALKVAVLKDGVPFSEFRPYEPIYDYDSLAELNEEWEDYNEPKEYWFINASGGVEAIALEDDDPEDTEGSKEIGNYFETREEAEKAVEKLKAWKRLKDNGFTIREWRHTPDMTLTIGSFVNIKGFIPQVMKNIEDLDLLFEGGDEQRD